MAFNYTGKAEALDAVAKDGFDLRFVSEALRSDPEVVLVAVRQSGWALGFASEALRANRNVVLEAVARSGWALEHASDELRGDRDVVLVAVRQSGFSLEYASSDLRADKEVVLEAVNRSGAALEYASEALRADEEVVVCAVNETGKALEHAGPELRKNKDMVLLAARKLEKGLDDECEDASPDHYPDFILDYFCAEEDEDEDDDAIVEFWEVVESSIAVRGEEGPPIATVELSYLPGRTAGDKEGTVGHFHCFVSSLSGASFELDMERQVATTVQRHELAPTARDLADEIVQALASMVQTPRVFITILQSGGTGEAVVVTPWDSKRPLSEFWTAPNIGEDGGEGLPT